MKELAFWLAVGLAGAVTIAGLKAAGPYLPEGARRLVATI